MNKQKQRTQQIKVFNLRSNKESNEKEEEAEMAAAKNALRDKELEEMKQALNRMSMELSTVAKQQTMLALMEEVKQLRVQLKEKDEKIESLEKRVDQLEQYSRMEDVIITGLETKHRSYASVARGDGDAEPPAEEIETLEWQVLTFLATNEIHVQSECIHPF